MEYALGSLPNISGSLPAPLQPRLEDHGGEVYLTITYTRSVNAGEVQFSAETSDDLETWISGGVPITPEIINPDGSIIGKFRHPISIGSEPQYLRLKVSK